jgi:hypothetical protein
MRLPRVVRLLDRNTQQSLSHNDFLSVATATFKVMLRFEKWQKPAWNGLCFDVAVQKGIGRNARLCCCRSESKRLEPQRDQIESCRGQYRRTSCNSAILSIRAPWHSRVVALPAKHGKDFWTAGGSASTRIGPAARQSRLRTGLPRRQICGARRMAHGQDFPGRSHQARRPGVFAAKHNRPPITRQPSDRGRPFGTTPAGLRGVRSAPVATTNAPSRTTAQCC